MSVSNDNQYAITLTEMTVHNNNNLPKNISKGSLLEIQNAEDSGDVKVIKVVIEEPHYERKILSPRSYNHSGIDGLIFLTPDVYKFAVAIKNRNERIKFCQSEEKQMFILQLKDSSPVKVPYGSFGVNDGSLRRAFVKYIGCLKELGPGYHFVVTLMKRERVFIPSLDNIRIPDCVEDIQNSAVVSAEHILDINATVCPVDVELFHWYRGKYYDPPSRMSRQSDTSEKLTKGQAYIRRNTSSAFDTTNNKNTTSKTVPEKPFNVDGKSIYVIDSSPEKDNAADIQIVQSSRYKDITDILLSTKWPKCAGPQIDLLNCQSEEQPSNTGSTLGKQSRSSPRTKSVNLLDHFNQDNRNSNKDIPTQKATTQARCSLRNQPRQAYREYENDINHVIDDGERPETFQKIPGSTLGIDAMVTVETGTGEPLNGVIRAIFTIGSIVMVGVEIEDFVSYAPLNLTDGTFSGHRFFQCQNGKALFIEADCCHKDNRFSDDFVAENKVFGHPESPVVTEDIPPISLKNLQELEEIIGESKGIQGHNNSCYLDATLFSMFTFAQCFDSLLYRNAEQKDIKHYDKVRAILRDEIVHPLRKHHFVRADRVLKLRELLEEISTMTGLTNEEKDPEEFMNILMAQTLKAEPYLKFNSGQDAFYYQLFVEKNDDLKLPNVQQLFEQSFKTSNIKLREVPPSLIIQMPRFGKNYKMYPRIVPSQVLDITDVVEGQPPACNADGRLATIKCLDCQEDYCAECFSKLHFHQNQNHKMIDIRSDFPTLRDNQTVPRIHMDLFAVVCIETSHYVSFVKAGELPDAPWLFFDSMSDRRGGQNGYNIPSMVSVPDLPEWLSEEGARKLHDSTPKDKLLPPFAKRLLCDAYMCMYVSRDVSMYK